MQWGLSGRTSKECLVVIQFIFEFLSVRESIEGFGGKRAVAIFG